MQVARYSRIFENPVSATFRGLHEEIEVIVRDFMSAGLILVVMFHRRLRDWSPSECQKYSKRAGQSEMERECYETVTKLFWRDA